MLDCRVGLWLAVQNGRSGCAASAIRADELFTANPSEVSELSHCPAPEQGAPAMAAPQATAAVLVAEASLACQCPGKTQGA